MFNIGFTFFTTFFGVYLRNNFGFDQSKTGDYFALVGLFIAFSQVVLVSRVSKKLSDWKVLRFSYFGMATMMLVYFLTPTSTPAYLYLVIPFFTAFNGLTMANMSSLVSRSAEAGKQGQAMGIYSSVQSLAQVPASILVGYITSGITSNTPLIVASVSIACGGLVFLTFFRPTFVDDVGVASSGAHPH
jgi:predicted MFS family arabinose efflux permease